MKTVAILLSVFSCTAVLNAFDSRLALYRQAVVERNIDKIALRHKELRACDESKAFQVSHHDTALFALIANTKPEDRKTKNCLILLFRPRYIIAEAVKTSNWELITEESTNELHKAIELSLDSQQPAARKIGHEGFLESQIISETPRHTEATIEVPAPDTSGNFRTFMYGAATVTVAAAITVGAYLWWKSKK